jgi:radical SAM superfamily enzyme YgiQ (UPF0313 family)
MKVVLVDNLIMPEVGSVAEMDVHPHLGLLALAAAAERDGHVVQIVDPKRAVRDGTLAYDGSLYARTAEALLTMQPDAIGFTALGCSVLFAINVASLIKARAPHLPILLGGPHATMLHREILERYDQFDIIVRYEADETFPAVLKHLGDRRFQGIPGISWRAAGDGRLQFTDGAPLIRDLDTLPLTSYDHYPVETLGLELLRIEAGRGCPFACIFCSTAGFFQRSFRLKSAGRLVAELDRLHQRYHCRDFKLDHDMFTTSKRKVAEFCDAVAERGYRWSASARIDCVDEALLELMAAVGCANLYFGIETGSPRMQAIVGKKLDLALVEPILARADALGIETTASFITGFPAETDEDLDQTLDLIGRCARRESCLTQLHLLAPEPGTPLFDAMGSTISYDGISGPYHCGLLGCGDVAEIVAAPHIFQTYYYYASTLPRDRSVRAVQLVDLLRRTGNTVFAYALRFFGGRLSLLMHALEAFAASLGTERIEATTLIEFAAHRLGSSHHVVSLLRFALHCGARTARSDVMPGIPVFDPDLAYVAPAGLTELATMHDCASLIERIRALPEGALLPDDPAEGAGVYLFVPSSGGTIVYLADPAIAVIVGLFNRPRMPRAVMRRLGIAWQDGASTWTLLAQLAAMGLIACARWGQDVTGEGRVGAVRYPHRQGSDASEFLGGRQRDVRLEYPQADSNRAAAEIASSKQPIPMGVDEVAEGVP